MVATMGVGEEEREKKVILIVCSKFFSFSCKISTWQFILEVVNIEVYTQSVLNLIFFFY